MAQLALNYVHTLLFVLRKALNGENFTFIFFYVKRIYACRKRGMDMKTYNKDLMK